jgi:hypothetical protein
VLVLAIWLLLGLFKKATWLISLLWFSLFSTIIIYKAVDKNRKVKIRLKASSNECVDGQNQSLDHPSQMA